MIRKGKNKKLITDSPGRKIRSRELKVCRFPQFKHFRGKSRHSPRPRTELSFAPLLPPALSSVRMLCSKHISAYWKKYLQRHLHSSLTCNYFTYRQKNLEKLKRPTSPVLSQERFRNNYFLSWRPAFELIFWLFSPQRELLTLCSHRWCELTDFPSPNPARPTLECLLRLKPGLSSHRWTRSHVLNPGLSLESPGALPTHHTDAPTGPRQNFVGRLLLNTGQVILIGNWVETTYKVLSEPFHEYEPLEVRSPL